MSYSPEEHAKEVKKTRRLLIDDFLSPYGFERPKSDKNQQAVGCGWYLLATLVYFVSTPLNYLWLGFVLVTIWNWYLAAALSVLTLKQGVGIILAFEFVKFGLKRAHSDSKLSEERPLAYSIGWSLGQFVGGLSILFWSWLLLFLI